MRRPPLAVTRMLFAFLLSAALPQTSLAGRPLATEDAGVIEPRRCEWESFGARLLGATVQTGLSTQLACGIGFGTQLGVVLSHVTPSEDQPGTIVGATGKTVTRALRDRFGTSLALAYGLDTIKALDGGYRLRTAFVNGVASVAVGEANVIHLNVGWLRDHVAREELATWNLAAEHAVSDTWSAMAEVYGGARAPTWFGVGARASVSERFEVNASVSQQAGAPNNRQVTVGGKFVF